MVRPATPEVGLEQLMADAEMWIRRCEVVMVEVRHASQKRLGRELCQRIEGTVAVLEEVQKVARLVKNDLVAMVSGKSMR